jgi:hypothetical protein
MPVQSDNEVRWTPTSMSVIPDVSLAGINLYTFDRLRGLATSGTVILSIMRTTIMMRPYRVTK